MVADEAMKAKRFERGLQPVVCSRLMALNIQTYREVVKRALLVEADLNSRREHQKGYEHRSRPKEATPYRSEKKSNT